MATGAEAQAIRLKLGDKRLQDAGAAGAVKRAFRLACARAAVEFSDLNMMVTDLQQQDVPLEQLLSGLNGAPAIMILEGPGEVLGVAVIDNAVISGLLEHVTTGRISNGTHSDRRPTKTDVAILADFLDRALGAIATELEEVPEPPMVRGFRYSRMLYEPRAAEMILENISYSQYQLGLDLEEGAKTGVIALSFPASKGRGVRRGGKVRSWSESWREQVDLVPVRVEAILDRPKMALRAVADLEVGQLIELPCNRIEQVSLVGTNGKIVARGKLGRQGLHRALRVENIGAPKRREQVDVSTQAGFETPNLGTDMPIADPLVPPTSPELAPMAPDIATPAIEPNPAVPAAAPMANPMQMDNPIPMATPMPMAASMPTEDTAQQEGEAVAPQPMPMKLDLN